MEGIMTFEDIKHEIEKARRILYPKLLKYFNDKNWEGFCNLVVLNPRLIPYGFLFYDEMPEQYKRDFVIDCYESHGDSYPSCRAALRKLPKNGKNELPEEYRNKEYITVYRAGEEPIEKSKYRISWTLDREIAESFLNGRGINANYLYSGKIKPCDVIAYNDNRSEQEVMQYKKVFDVQLIKRKGA